MSQLGRIKYRPPNPLMEIIWGDAWNGSSWFRKSEIKCDPLLVATMGYLASENKNGYVLAASVSEQGMMCSDFFIPRGMVKSVKRLKR